MPNYGIDKHIYIWYIEHMNMMLLDDLTAERISEDMPNCDALTALADYFDALSDTTRLKILSALSASPMCVTDLSTLTGLNQTTVSHQLRILRAARIVEFKRQGKVMFYSLAAGGFPEIMDLAVGAVTGREIL